MSEISEFQDPLIGRKLGQCFIEAPLGQGGMAKVYRAIRDEDEAVVAVKVIQQHFAAKPQFTQRFEREAHLMQALEHPSILPVYEHGTIGDVAYLVMRLLPGGALGDLLEKGALPEDMVVRFIEQICSALDFAHSKGVIHRDLKPANVLLDDEMNAYLTDFGIAKWKEETTGLTLTGMVVGTPGYMSPEQWRTDPVDARTDVYALGVMFFEMMTGQLPFKAETPFSLMYKHLDEPPPFASQLNRDLSPSVDLVLHRAMAKFPEKRYQSAGALATSLLEALAAEDDEMATAIQPKPLDHTIHATEVMPRDATAALEGERDSYNAIDIGARTLLNRAREVIRETSIDDVTILAGAVIEYVENLRQLAKHKPEEEEGPYKALESYDIADSRLFFGREAAIDGMLARSPFAKFTVLHAESGAGKTSLIRAGLMPRLLAGGYLPLYVAVRRQAPHQAIKHILLPDPAIAPSLTKDASLRSYLSGVARIVGENREIFIFVDQFETFFTDVFTDEERGAFVSELAACLDDPALQIRITLAMRTEYFGMLASFQPAIEQPFDKEFLLRRLKREEAERALVRPVEAQGYTYEDEATALVLDDLTDEAGEIAPPQLQLVGTALIENLPPERNNITKEDFENAGGAKGVLSNFLSRVLERLPTADRQPARVILESLVRPDQTRDVRTAESLRTELDILGIETDNLDNLLRILRENHILRVLDTADGLAYELVHDYLALQVQIDPETAARKAAQELLDRGVEAYNQYGALLTREELEVILAQEELLRQNSDARELISSSRRRLRRQRRIAIALTVATVFGLIGVLAIGLFAVARESQNRQDRLESAQTAEARIAVQSELALRNDSRRLAELAIGNLSSDPVTALNLAIASFTPRSRPYGPEGELALHRSVQTVNERLYIAGSGAAYSMWSADGTRILQWDGDVGIRIINEEDGEELIRISHPEAPVVSATWSPDEEMILAGDAFLNVYVFDANSGEQLFQDAIEHEEWDNDAWIIDQVAWDSTGEYFLASSLNAKTTILWRMPGEVVEVFAGSQARWSPDGTRLLTILNDNGVHNVYVWDIVGQLQFTLQKHDNRVEQAQWIADGERILTWGNDGDIIVWDANSGEDLNTIQASDTTIYSVSLTPDEQTIFVSTPDTFTEIDLSTSEVIGEPRRLDPVNGVLWSPDESIYVTYGDVGAFGIWDSITHTQVVNTDLSGYADDVRFVQASWNPVEDHYVLTVSRNNKLRVWDVHIGAEVTSLIGHTGSINNAYWNITGDEVLTSADDGSTRIWKVLDNGVEVGHGEVMRMVTDSSGPAFMAKWNADESLIASGHGDGSVHIWSADTGEQLHHLAEHRAAPISRLAWKDNRLLSGGEDGQAIIWNTITGEALHILDNSAVVMWVAWNADGSKALTTADDGTIRIWDASTSELILHLVPDDVQDGIGVGYAAWNADETKILTAGDDGTVRVWDSTSGEELLKIEGATVFFRAMWNADETQILAWGSVLLGSLTGVYDANTGEPLFMLEGHQQPVITASWSPDEQTIITTSRDTTARLWDANTGELLYILENHQDSVIGNEWNAESTRVLTSSADTTMRIWDVNTGLEIQRFDSLPRINSIQWNQDETLILTANEDGSVRLWRTWPNLDEMLNRAKALVTRPLSPEQRNTFFVTEEE